jgi:hypothetical protein
MASDVGCDSAGSELCGSHFRAVATDDTPPVSLEVVHKFA